MKIIMAALADAVNTSQEGKLNLLGIFQTILTEKVPCAHFNFYIVAVIRLEISEKGEDHNFWIRVADQDQEEICKIGPIPILVPVETPSSNPEYQSIIKVQALQFLKFGSHYVEFYIDREPSSVNPDHHIELFVQPLVQRIEEIDS